MAVTVDDWRKSEADALNTAAAEYAKIANELDNLLTQLTQLGKTIFGDQLSGPPAELLNTFWVAFLQKVNPVSPRLHALAGDLTKTAQNWVETFNQQKAALEKEVQDAKDAAAKAAAAANAANAAANK